MKRVAYMLALCIMFAPLVAVQLSAVTTTASFTTEALMTVPFALIIDENGVPVTEPGGVPITVANAVPETDDSGNPVTTQIDVPVTDEAGEAVTLIAYESVTDANGALYTEPNGMPVTTQIAVPVTEAVVMPVMVEREESSEPTDPVEPTKKFTEHPAVRGAFAGGVVIALAMIVFLILRAQKRPADAKEKSSKTRLSIGNLTHIGQRDSQQDSFGVSDISDENLVASKGVLAVVADGIGGLQGGAEISSVVTSYFMQNFEALPNQLTPSEQLLRLTQEANRKSLGSIQGNMSGSTLVAAILKDGQLWFVSVGDSRIYLLREGALVQLNREHTMASQLDEDAARGRITVDEARSDKQRGALTSFIGMGELKLIDKNLGPIALQPGDQVLLMTDGVFGTLNDEEMLAILTAHAPYAAAAALEKAVLAKQKPKQDNFTAIILGM